jgi:hypothetical protein
MTVETSSVTGPVNLYLNRYLFISLITHAVNDLILFALCYIASVLTAVVAVVTRYWYHGIIPDCDHLYLQRGLRALTVMSSCLVFC